MGGPATSAPRPPAPPPPVRQRARRRALFLQPFRRFFRLEAASGILLLAAALLALLWANSPLAPFYFQLWETNLTVGLERFVLSKPLLLWINDGLMAVFFFVVGLEIKREVLVGELSSPKKAALPVTAALGGMLVPALFYVLANASGAGARGWGIPMATDIAFALGVVALLGARVPLSLKVFITAVAVTDDLGAVLVIALFYTSELSFLALGLAALVLATLLAANRLGVSRISVYTLLGSLLWMAFLESGIHAAVAGVLLAMTIPASRRGDPRGLEKHARALLKHTWEARPSARWAPQLSRPALHALEKAIREADIPLSRLEHALQPWVAFGIMPLFALANAGVPLGGHPLFPLHPVTLGVLLGLVLGKPLGVLLFAWFALRLGIAALPAGVGWREMCGLALLTGIGFTMSLFIAGLAFGSSPLMDAAKLGILAASLLSGLAGWLVLRGLPLPPPEPAESAESVEPTAATAPDALSDAS